MNSSVRISVVMPLYNKAPYVADAIASILQQTHPAWEIIVIDDGSTDGGAEVVKQFADPRIKLVYQSNAGSSVARNHGIDLATGNYIAFLDADDLYRPGFLAKIVELIADYPQAGMFCTGYTCFWDSGYREVRGLCNTPPGSSLCVPNFFSAWVKASFTCTIAIALESRLLKSLSVRFPPGEKLGEDQDLWFRVAELTPVAYANIPLADYRMGVQGSATQVSTVTELLPCYQRLSDRLQRDQVPTYLQSGARRLLASHILNVVRANLSVGNRPKATKFLLDRRAFQNPLYFLRTVLAVIFSRPKVRTTP